jgi:hypothetical protein
MGDRRHLAGPNVAHGIGYYQPVRALGPGADGRPQRRTRVHRSLRAPVVPHANEHRGRVDERGLDINDLPGIYREGYLYAVEIARAQYDPCSEWVEFSDTLWNYLIRVFGLDADEVPV